jgi:hypothetical protein
MSEAIPSNGLNIESLLNTISSEFSTGDSEDKKITAARIRVNTKNVQTKRQERIDNLIKQMKGVGGASGCMKIAKVVFKAIDLLIKPLSALSLGALKMDLSKSLEMLEEAKKQGRLLGLKINGQEISKALQSFKTFLQSDMQTLKQQDEQSAKDAERIVQILDEIEQTFKTTTNGLTNK